MAVYLLGVVVGLGIYGMAYLFAKKTSHGIRVLTVATVSILLAASGLIIIGGFEGIPFLILSLGILTVASLFGLFGRSFLGRKIVITAGLIVVIVYGLFMYVNRLDYYVVSKSPIYGFEGDLGAFVKTVEQDPTSRGYKVFPFTEGDTAIVLALGGEMAGNNIEIVDIEEKNEQTSITVRTFYNQSTEQNPYIIIGLNRVQPKMVIRDTNGFVFEEYK